MVRDEEPSQSGRKEFIIDTEKSAWYIFWVTRFHGNVEAESK